MNYYIITIIGLIIVSVLVYFGFLYGVRQQKIVEDIQRRKLINALVAHMREADKNGLPESFQRGISSTFNIVKDYLNVYYKKEGD